MMWRMPPSSPAPCAITIGFDKSSARAEFPEPRAEERVFGIHPKVDDRMLEPMDDQPAESAAAQAICSAPVVRHNPY